MSSKSPTPGLKKRGKLNQKVWIGWCASSPAVTAGFRPTVVRLPYSLKFADHRPLIEAACQRLQEEMLLSMASRHFDEIATKLKIAFNSAEKSGGHDIDLRPANGSSQRR